MPNEILRCAQDDKGKTQDGRENTQDDKGTGANPSKAKLRACSCLLNLFDFRLNFYVNFCKIKIAKLSD